MLSFGDMAFTSNADRQTLLEHSARNARYEEDRVSIEKQERQAYKQMMIDEIIANTDLTFDDLRRKTTTQLERIYDNY